MILRPAQWIGLWPHSCPMIAPAPVGVNEQFTYFLHYYVRILLRIVQGDPTLRRGAARRRAPPHISKSSRLRETVGFGTPGGPGASGHRSGLLVPLPKQQGHTPQSRDSYHRVDNAGEHRHLAAAEERHHIKAKEPDGPPVQRADDDKNERNPIDHVLLPPFSVEPREASHVVCPIRVRLCAGADFQFFASFQNKQ